MSCITSDCNTAFEYPQSTNYCSSTTTTTDPTTVTTTAATAAAAVAAPATSPSTTAAPAVEAKAWLKEMDKAFTLIEVTGEKKTEYSGYFLKNEASYWWETKLKQGSMTVSQYETKFTELSRFVPTYVDTEKKKAKRFQQGLR
ncbi:hypothetical protein POM88_021781 [Heracleum sosnowskyi]|uniref:Retrotransposon gag domain-containing protein n=1 Tax=Heracleum sosnowskyi TaxID=360622 RepID=A0AAD8MSU2_9APIA|nr:hypothetical protein POM88_021781 [Heracleum sosnowskyi]